jgi:hypothetical protein
MDLHRSIPMVIGAQEGTFISVLIFFYIIYKALGCAETLFGLLYAATNPVSSNFI